MLICSQSHMSKNCSIRSEVRQEHSKLKPFQFTSAVWRVSKDAFHGSAEFKPSLDQFHFETYRSINSSSQKTVVLLLRRSQSHTEV